MPPTAMPTATVELTSPMIPEVRSAPNWLPMKPPTPVDPRMVVAFKIPRFAAAEKRVPSEFDATCRSVPRDEERQMPGATSEAPSTICGRPAWPSAMARAAPRASDVPGREASALRSPAGPSHRPCPRRDDRASARADLNSSGDIPTSRAIRSASPLDNAPDETSSRSRDVASFRASVSSSRSILSGRGMSSRKLAEISDGFASQLRHPHCHAIRVHTGRKSRGRQLSAVPVAGLPGDLLTRVPPEDDQCIAAAVLEVRNAGELRWANKVRRLKRGEASLIEFPSISFRQSAGRWREPAL